MNLVSRISLIPIVTISLSLTGNSASSEALDINSDTLVSDSSEISPVQENIMKQINRLEHSKALKSGKQKIIGNSIIIEFYKDANYNVLWDSPKNRKDLISILEDSYFEGLNPNDYHIQFIKSYNEEIKKGAEVSTEDIALADIAMTNATLTYVFHMIQGKVHPTQLDPNWNYSLRSLPDSVEFRFLHRLQTESLKEAIDKIRPELPIYHECCI